MKRKYILMSMIAAATLASCSKDDSDNIIDNNNNSVVEVEKTVENGVNENVENGVETIKCPVTITVNKGNSVSKIGVADGGLGEVFTSGDQLRVFLLDGETRGAQIGTLDLTDGTNTNSGTFSGQIEIAKPQGDEGYPNELQVIVLVSKMDSKLSGFSNVYTDLSAAVADYAYLSSSAKLSASTVAANQYPTYSTSSVQLVDQTSYLVVSASFGGTTPITINDQPFSLGNGSVLAFEGGIKINSADLNITNWSSAVGAKYTFDLSSIRSIILNETTIVLGALTATGSLSATINPTSAETNVSWTSSNTDIVTVSPEQGKSTEVTGKKAGEAIITATVNGMSATCLVKVAPQTITFKENDNSLTLTYYSDQKWSDLNGNADNKNLGSYSTVNNYYVKIFDKWLKNGDAYVTVNDAIEAETTYTLVSDAPTASITLDGNTIFYSEGQTWEQIAARTDNAGVLTSHDYDDNKYYTIGNLEVGVKGSDATKLVLGTDVVNSTQEYLLYSAVL